tara:strand:- start:515 stop:1504 length:990 start_codon:yes stop_codon:yes gene_type:complete
MNRNILITGASSGIGFEAILNLIKKGHKIIAPCRTEIRSQDTLLRLKNANIPNVDIDKQLNLPVLDLANLKDITKFIDNLIANQTQIDTLILNAGLQYTGAKDPFWSSDGYELTFAVNHLSHQYLADRLLPLLTHSKSPRIIITSSEVHNPEAPGGRIGEKASLGKLNGLKSTEGFKMLDGSSSFNADKAYKDSKLCNILLAKELYKRISISGDKCTVIAWAPGLIIPRTTEGFFRYSRKNNEFGQRLFAFFARDVFRITESPQKAGSILSELADDSKFLSSSFKYFSNKLIRPGKKVFEESEISSEALDDNLSEELWDRCSSIYRRTS